MAESKTSGMGRRGFLKTAAATAGLLIVKPGAVRGLEANSKVEVGIIGCGGRGVWLGELFNADGNAQVVAVHDYFKDRVHEAGKKLGVDAARRHIGLEGYKELLAGKVEAVAVVSPPYFHPEHAVATLEAGKHLYLAKPMAVDVPGVMAITHAAAKVKGKLSTLVDFQTRVNEFYMGAVERIRAGLIGKPVCGEACFINPRLGARAKPGTQTARLRNWVFDIALSGDIIVEQSIHALDVANWFLNAHPLKAFGTGGRKARTDIGDCWDHFIVTYWYPNDVKLAFMGTQFCVSYFDLCCRIYGDLGTADSHYGGLVNIRAKHGGYRGGKTTNIYKDGAVTNIKNFFESIKAKEYVNNTVQDAADSTLTAILGRTAAYEGRTVTWDELIKSKTRLDPKLDLPAGGSDSRD